MTSKRANRFVANITRVEFCEIKGLNMFTYQLSGQGLRLVGKWNSLFGSERLLRFTLAAKNDLK